MENVCYVRTFATILVLALLSAYAFSAEKDSEVSLRYSRQGVMVRLVFEASDETIRNATVHASPAGIRIDFPSAFQLRKPNDFIFEIAKSPRSLFVKLKDAAEIKTLRLAAPSRIVFDITTVPSGPREAMPPAGPAVSPGPQKETPRQPPLPKPDQKETAHKPAQPQAGQKVQQAPQSEEKMHVIKVVVLDPGHGGYEYGIADGSVREKDVNLQIARDLSAALAKKGKTVILTRKVDQSTSLAERINFANAKNPDLFVSVHAGLSANFVIYLAPPEDQNVDATVKLYALSYRQGRFIDRSRAAATAIGLSIKNDFNTEVTLRELPLPVLNSLSAPAIMIEYPSLKTYASDQKVREKLVASILKGVAAYEH